MKISPLSTLTPIALLLSGHEYHLWGLSMCTCLTKSGPRVANAVGEEHLQMWHALNVHKCVLLGKGLIDFKQDAKNRDAV